MALLLRVPHQTGVLKSCVGSLSFIQKASLKNELPAVTVPGLHAHTPKEDQRFPENITWPEELDWVNTNSHWQARRPYQPPSDLVSRLSEVFAEVLGAGQQALDTPLSDLSDKYRVLTACADRLGHDVTNSQLHRISTLGDVVRYYSEPVNTATPLEQLKEQDLPQNLHIQLDYLRFHPETDTKFGGVSAFPKRSTVVSSIKHKKKYKGYAARKSWPYS